MAMILDCMLRITLVIYIAFVVVNGNFVVKPINTHVMLGQSATLMCTVTGAGTGSAQQCWKEYYSDPAAPSIVSQDSNVLPTGTYRSEFNITGTYNLKAVSAKMKHGAKYSCESSWETGPPTAYAEIIVLESHPVCAHSIPSNTVIENDVITYRCEFTYQGKWAPVMMWRNKNNIPIPSNNLSTTHFVKYSIDITARKADDQQQYTCTTKFADTLDPPPGTDTATNIPTYINTYISEVLTVHWYPRNTQILDKNNNPIADGSELYPGVLKCVTDSNPPPDTYIWRDNTDNSTLGNSQYIMVDITWLGVTSITCVVRNVMGRGNNGVIGEDSIFITISIKTTTTTTTIAQQQTSEPTTDRCLCMDNYQKDSNKDTVNAAIVGGVLGSLLTIICLVFGAFLLRMYIPITNIKGVDKPVDNPQSTTVYQNVDISQEKPYVQLDVNTREEEVNPYRNDYMELRVT